MAAFLLLVAVFQVIAWLAAYILAIKIVIDEATRWFFR